MTIKDIAREAGYAVGTVSRVLNGQPGVSEKARKRIMEVVNKYDFRLNTNAKLLKQQYNNEIVIIVKGTKNMLFAGLVETLQGLIKQKGYACLIYYIHEDEHEVEQALQICRDRQPMGILFLGSNKENFKEKFEYIKIPCVLVTNSATGLDFPNLSSVSVDDTLAAKAVIEYLISLGHRKIGILGGEMEHSNPAKLRWLGCLQAFQEHNIFFDKDTQYAMSYFTIEDGYKAMSNLLETTKDISAVFAMSDVTALGAIRAIQDHGLRIPEDISIVGYDGIELGQFVVPRLATIQQPSNEIAVRSVEILLKCIEGKESFVCEQIPFHLIAGESTKAIN